ncbi:MAG: DUF4166 domain-containing protein [Pseudomonadota bacterium]
MNQPSMYSALMGDAFNRLANPIQQFHTFAGHHEFRGVVEVASPASFIAKLLAVFLGAPLKATQGPIRFELWAKPDTETWTRFFPGKTMRSTLTKSGNRITERLGASLLTFELLEVEGALEMRLEKLYFLGIRCPVWLMPELTARETGEDQKLHFHIQASVPLVGRVANYTGYLIIPSGGSE